MYIRITSDSNWEARIETVMRKLNRTGYRPFFEGQNYGSSILGVSIILMCREKELNFKKRIRFDKKNRKLYMDIMLDIDLFMSLSEKGKDKVVVDKIAHEVPRTIAKYKFQDFDHDTFERDLREIMGRIL